MKRLILTGAAILMLLSGAVPGTRPATAEAGTVCLLYCETIYVGCLATVASVDREACTSWRDGCRDGCQASD